MDKLDPKIKTVNFMSMKRDDKLKFDFLVHIYSTNYAPR